MSAVLMQSEILVSAMRGIYSHLTAYARGRVNDDPVACMFATWHCGGGALPERMGLSMNEFRSMMDHHFPGAPYEMPDAEHVAQPDRSDEIDEIYRLLLLNRANQSDSELWIAMVIAIGCMGSDHLWQDMGLWSRRDLTSLMNRNFPSLRNDKNMKWKKYLYKQLCETEGIYTCRSPSCEVCADYQLCFSTEE